MGRFIHLMYAKAIHQASTSRGAHVTTRLNLPFAEVTPLGCHGRCLLMAVTRTARERHPAPPRCWGFVLFNCASGGEGFAELLTEM